MVEAVGVAVKLPVDEGSRCTIPMPKRVGSGEAGGHGDAGLRTTVGAGSTFLLDRRTVYSESASHSVDSVHRSAVVREMRDLFIAA